MALRYLYLLLFFGIACNSYSDERKINSVIGEKTTFKSTDLSIACTRAIKTLDNEIHGLSFMSNTGQSVSKDSLLYDVSKYDISDNGKFETYLKRCSHGEFFTLKSTTHKNVITRIEMASFKITIPMKDGHNNKISITDYDIFSVTNPSHIALRIINDYDIQYLAVGKTTYSKFFGSIPTGFNSAIARFDSVKNACR